MVATKPQPRHIALMPGDGIGAEVVAAAEQVLTQLRDHHHVDISWDTLEWPSTAWHQEHGRMMPEDAMHRVKGYDALLLGALGDPGPTSDPQRYRLPDGISLAPLLAFRKELDLWACERPARLLPGAPQFLADPRAADIDMLVIRENSEGEYVNQGGRMHRGTPNEVATQLEVFTRRATERLIRHAFLRARRRLVLRGETKQFYCAEKGQAFAQLCLVTKRNAQPAWGELYSEVFDEIAREFPEIGTRHELVDAACMKFVQCPWEFDVVVASNLHGDILTDLAAVLSGGLGLAPSCNINPDSRAMPALFEPTHGSAPDIAGQGLANPSAMLLTTAMMLEWLGFTAAGEQLRAAVAADLVSNGHRNRNCQEITQGIIAAL
ncbi:tartrate dehydrogenase/decarboxylase / D-malate dehydrogenase [Halopseudomonas salegens]|uniref:Tartrate dehydrogenase/decarboxylase / D-malate dehydrogenase n=2 Tax=Halopseudomonas salegens TaxID=1434072 RepID=A0A1H2GJD0_9GAMM|nr:tartrate dehydrogenase/decarboxylase / D-malate dehydrogenase [Halopseudomonas salegens]